jgi:AraC-like DNA-binding protein
MPRPPIVSARLPFDEALRFILASDCTLSPSGRLVVLAIVYQMRQQPDGSFSCDLTINDLAARAGLSSRQTRRLLGKHEADAIARHYPNLLTWRPRTFAVDAGRHHIPLTFSWIGDTRTADQIADEPAEVPNPPPSDEHYAALVAALQAFPDPEFMLGAWARMEGMAPTVARLRADNEVQALINHSGR